MLADKAYDADWIRNMIWEQGAIDVIPSKSNRKIPKEFDKEMYRQRNKIERFSVASRLPSAVSPHDTNKHLQTSSR